MEKYHGNKTPRDNEYLDAYLKTHSQVKAAEICGVGRETIARAVRRANIPLDGRKYNDGSSNGQQKITDAELKEEALLLDSRSIAIKYGMSEERVYRRAKQIGIKLKTNNIGGHWKQRAERYGSEYFDDSITLKKVREKYKDICQICGKPVDDNDIINGHIRRLYPTVDHITPLSKGGTHTWNNVQLAHMSCNAGKCDNIIKDKYNTVKREGVWT